MRRAGEREIRRIGLEIGPMTSIDVIASALGERAARTLGEMSSPDGALTLLFCDIEDAAEIGEELGAERFAELLARPPPDRRAGGQPSRGHGGQGPRRWLHGRVRQRPRGAALRDRPAELARRPHRPGRRAPTALRAGLHTGFVILNERGDVRAQRGARRAHRRLRARGGDHGLLDAQGVHRDRSQLPLPGARRAPLQRGARRTPRVRRAPRERADAADRDGARNSYITAMGPHSGKSVVALGFTGDALGAPAAHRLLPPDRSAAPSRTRPADRADARTAISWSSTTRRCTAPAPRR